MPSLRIFLTGYMGAGKTTIGRQLASRLGYEFVDTDKALVQQFGKSISRIFTEDGEQAFRDAEQALIEDLSSQANVVISTGGGTLARLDTLNVAKETGTVVYLAAPVSVLYERAIFSHKDRPMLNVPNSEQVFSERFAQRQHFYEQADVMVATNDKTTAQVVAELAELLLNAQHEG